jgi:hypothetical protein
MKKTNLLLLLLIFLPIVNAESMTFIFEVDSQNSFIMKEMYISQASAEQKAGAYSFILSGKGKELYSTGFDYELTAWAETGYPFPPGTNVSDFGKIDLSSTQIVIQTPLYLEVDSYKITKEGKTLASGNIILCNKNNVCEKGETSLTCQDCSTGSEDGYCDSIEDSICDKDCETVSYLDVDCTCGNSVCDFREDQISCPKDCGKGTSKFLIYSILIGLFLLLLIAGIIFLIVRAVRKKKKRK